MNFAEDTYRGRTDNQLPADGCRGWFFFTFLEGRYENPYYRFGKSHPHG